MPMAGSKTDYLEAALLNHSTGKLAYAKPTTFVALYTAAPSDAGGGTEVSGSAYARVTTAASDWTSAAQGNPSSISNATVLTFPTPTGSWGVVTHFALLDAVTVGNMLWWGSLTTSQTVSNGNVVSFAVGALVLTED